MRKPLTESPSSRRLTASDRARQGAAGERMTRVATAQIDPPPFSGLQPADQVAGDASGGGGARVRPWQAWLLLLLTFSVVLAFADRGIMSILVDPIKADLGIGDVQVSLLIGFSFSVIYSLSALPLGALVDRLDRRRMIALAIFAWSGMTVLCGLATSFGQLFAGRMGLGIAEAVLGPAAFSLIRSSFPPTQRGRAFAFFNSSHLIGTGSALLVGGSLFGLAQRGGLADVPLVGGLAPWQQVMVTLGLAGVPVAMLVLTVREPARTGRRASGNGFGEAFRYVAANRRVLLPFWAGLALFALAQGGASGWTAMAVHRTWQVPIPDVGRVLGPIQMAVGLTGSFSLGYVMDLLARRGRPDAPIIVCVAGLGLSGLAMAAQLAIHALPLAGIVYVVQIFFFAAYAVAASAGLALIAPPALAGKLQAITGLATSLVGLASGPTVVALASEHLFSGPDALHDALATVVATAVAGGVGLFLLVSRALHARPPAAAGP